ncbi:hypothetical protein [Microcoleus asticus]|uniref:hypothetical protein n=1 Tax=Microcoleus asticus TaxID=2815231 RepID=UPI001557F7AD|nr:hypothetical protein [Microcoleus asticus]
MKRSYPVGNRTSHLLLFSAKLHIKPIADRVSSVLKSAGHPSGRSMQTDNWLQ